MLFLVVSSVHWLVWGVLFCVWDFWLFFLFCFCFFQGATKDDDEDALELRF